MARTKYLIDNNALRTVKKAAKHMNIDYANIASRPESAMRLAAAVNTLGMEVGCAVWAAGNKKGAI